MSEIKIDQLIRSHRKTIGLHISNDASLIVRAPLFASESHIYKLIETKASWIRSKQDYFRKRRESIKVRKFESGEEFLFLGKMYSLKVVEDLPKAVVFADDLMISQLVLKNARDHLESWYKTQAFDYIALKTDYFAKLAGLRYESIKVNNASTRWGSCGYKDTLNFTWRLIMAPPEVIDYVIVHELMHIKEKNHSRRFWLEVYRMMPDYKKYERWLKGNGHLLGWA